MERRTIIAYILIGLLTFLWMWTGRKTADREPMEQAVETTPAVPPETPAEAEPAAPAEGQAPVLTATSDVPLQDEIVIADPSLKYQLVWTNRGAALRRARLTDYPESLDSETGVLLLDSSEEAAATLALADRSGFLPLSETNYELLESSPQRIAFAATFKNGLRVVKEYFPRPGRYDMGVKISFQNASAEPVETQVDIIAAGRIKPEGGTDPDVKGVFGFQYETGRYGHKKLNPKDVRKAPFIQHNGENPMVWAGAVNRYFAAILELKNGDTWTSTDAAAVEIRHIGQVDTSVSSTGRVRAMDNVQTRFQLRRQILQPGENCTMQFTYFLGPISKDVLANHPELNRLIDYGFFGVISKLLLAMLNFLHRFIPNYGVGIILMTLIVRLCLFPLNRKTQLAMHRMQKLQPLIKEMQEKYKDDKQRQGRELMDLYRKHNANPMASCLPIFLQLPIFFGLFRMLQNSIDLRQEGFIFWISDLSRPDTLPVQLGGFPIRILPIVMVVSWVVQQMMMPKPADPQQAQTQKMMMFMPIMFGFFMYGVASGLTLYWTVSTFFGILEQKLIRWQIKRKEQRGEFNALKAEVAAPREKPRRK